MKVDTTSRRRFSRPAVNRAGARKRTARALGLALADIDTELVQVKHENSKPGSSSGSSSFRVASSIHTHARSILADPLRLFPSFCQFKGRPVATCQRMSTCQHCHLLPREQGTAISLAVELSPQLQQSISMRSNHSINQKLIHLSANSSFSSQDLKRHSLAPLLIHTGKSCLFDKFITPMCNIYKYTFEQWEYTSIWRHCQSAKERQIGRSLYRTASGQSFK